MAPYIKTATLVALRESISRVTGLRRGDFGDVTDRDGACALGTLMPCVEARFVESRDPRSVVFLALQRMGLFAWAKKSWHDKESWELTWQGLRIANENDYEPTETPAARRERMLVWIDGILARRARRKMLRHAKQAQLTKTPVAINASI